MSSAGNSSCLFGDQKSVLLVDFTTTNNTTNIDDSTTVVPLHESTSSQTSLYVDLFRYLKVHSTSPGLSFYYTASTSSVHLRIETAAGPVRFSHFCILQPSSNTASTMENITRLVERIQSLHPSVPSDRHKTMCPGIILVAKEVVSYDNNVIRGVDRIFTLSTHKDEDSSAARMAHDIAEFLSNNGTGLASATARANMRDLEVTLPNRSALVDPEWITEIVDKTYKHLEADAIFPTLEEEEVERLSGLIDSWDFFAPSLTLPQLLTVILLIFEKFDLINTLDVPLDIFKEYILVIALNYHDNPYHNFYHAVDVLQCCYYVLNASLMLRRLLPPIDIFALFTAALSHDVGHFNFNNPFLVEHESLVAWLYNDRGVLENLHSSVMFAILRNPRYNFAAAWPRGQWKTFRTLVVGAILGTDMAQHFEYIRQFSGMDGAFARTLRSINNGESNLLPLEDRRLLAVAIIKFADICNVVRPFQSARQWGFHLVCEFFHQGDWEKALGYQGSPMTRRSLPDLGKGQQYFLHNVASPLYRCLAEHFSELHFAEEQLRINLEHWRTWTPETDKIIHNYAELYRLDRERKHSH